LSELRFFLNIYPFIEEIMAERILITQPIDDSGQARLEAAGFILDVWPGPEPMPYEVLLERVSGCGGLLSMLTDRIDAAVLDAGPIRVVAQHAVGINNIDLDAVRGRCVGLAHTPGVLTDATADLAMALILSAGRRIVESDRFVRSGQWQGWGPTLMRGLDLNGSVLGIVGMGRIGRAVARRAEAFGMTVVHHNRSSGIALDALLETSDVVSLHCPLTPATRHLIDRAAFARMKSSAILVNTARGPVVDEAALVSALETGEIAGAGLDVFEGEPAIHPGLLKSERAVLLPHIGSATWNTRRVMAEMCADNLIAGLQGQPLPNGVSLS
jgi:glyoxylate reductase